MIPEPSGPEQSDAPLVPCAEAAQIGYLRESTERWAKAAAANWTWGTDEALRKKKYEAGSPDRPWRISGDCPSCGHAISRAVFATWYPEDTGSWDGLRHRVVPSMRTPARRVGGAIEVLVSCNCTVDHPDAPDGREGCGRYGWVGFVPARDSGDGRGRLCGGERASPDELRWELRTQELRATALDSVRAAAEKWARTVTSVTGVVSIGLVVKGPRQFSSIPGGSQAVLGVFLGIAVVCALGAIFSAALAAEGTPKLRGFTGPELRWQMRHQAKYAKLQLKVSRALAVLAVLLTLAALAIAWF